MFVNMFLFDNFFFVTIGIPEKRVVFSGNKITTTKYTPHRMKTIVAPLAKKTKMSRSWKIQLTQRMFSLNILTHEPYWRVSLIYALFARGNTIVFVLFKLYFLYFVVIIFTPPKAPTLLSGSCKTDNGVAKQKFVHNIHSNAH